MSDSFPRHEFIQWVDSHDDPHWDAMYFTHVSKAILARDIAESKEITPSPDDFMKKNLVFLFYGRPAYRVAGDGVIKVDAACPICFAFRPDLIKEAISIYPFDTGAYYRRMYAHILIDEIKPADYNIGTSISRMHKLIGATYGSLDAYYRGDMRRLGVVEENVKPWQYLTRAYLQLLNSRGRNEPDDRVSTIELLFENPIDINKYLSAVVVPHTHWSSENSEVANWVLDLKKKNVEIIPYEFQPDRHTESYHNLIESCLRNFYARKNIL